MFLICARTENKAYLQREHYFNQYYVQLLTFYLLCSINIINKYEVLWKYYKIIFSPMQSNKNNLRMQITLLIKVITL